MTPTLLTVGLLSGLTALATGLGVAPFFLLRRQAKTHIALSHAFAAGLMIAASIGLLWEGAVSDVPLTAAGLAVGVVFALLGGRLLGAHDEIEFGALRARRCPQGASYDRHHDATFVVRGG